MYVCMCVLVKTESLTMPSVLMNLSWSFIFRPILSL